jgi:hypothetical protein
VTGEVIRQKRSKRKGGRFAYAPVFSFSAADGRTYTVTSNVSSYPSDFSVGVSVRVRYDPANPQNARIHTFNQTWGVAVNAGITAVILAVVLVSFYPKLLELLHLAK